AGDADRGKAGTEVAGKEGRVDIHVRDPFQSGELMDEVVWRRNARLMVSACGLRRADKDR
ncbi:MAG: hypothetical protein ACREF0_20310, partial [Acetobacteraceae bacterium]